MYRIIKNNVRTKKYRIMLSEGFDNGVLERGVVCKVKHRAVLQQCVQSPTERAVAALVYLGVHFLQAAVLVHGKNQVCLEH